MSDLVSEGAATYDGAGKLKNMQSVRVQGGYNRDNDGANVSSEQTITDNVSQRVLLVVATD